MLLPYYCSPPLHTDPSYDPVKVQGVWLAVSPHYRAPRMGCYTSWEFSRAACEGVPGGGGVSTVITPIRCQRGMHIVRSVNMTMPSNPSITQRSRKHRRVSRYTEETPRNTKPPVPTLPLPTSLSTKKAPCMPTFEHSGSPPPSFANPELPAFATAPLSTPRVAALMPPDMHFAVRGGEVVHSRLSDTMNQYTQGVSSLGEVALMVTSNPFKAMFFSMGSTESTADELET
ncbi:hypothetical protein DFH09DRAFT_1302137 [Mycena vulgaris]|nr:hypothetical protein DFH09DRAFT_1302137 [Mycena vulgaris]